MRLSSFVGACALVLGVPALASAQGQKFAYVNSAAILQSAPGRTEAEAQFDKDMTSMRAAVQKLSDSLNTLQEVYAKEEVSLSPAAKEARLKTLREKQAAYQERVQKLQEQAQAREAELMQPIMDNVRKVLDDIRAEGGFAFIFDVAAGSLIVSADKNLDITDRVVSKLRLAAPRAAAKPAPAGPASAPAGLNTKKPPTA
ncbi:OmpH family outer membrane protein [Gemmatimonas sp.]|uniref:OmpH family outer membrane protein n=1 Tax=Gemmatimonas sp. TaxID=1962908 RepID=UPI0039837668